MQEQLYLIELSNEDEPVVVVKPDGKISSVNYTAKSMGVKREQGLEDARALCRQAGTHLEEITVQEHYGKPDTFTPLMQSNRVLDSIFRWAKMRDTKTPIKIERTFRDDFYIDVTDLVNEKMKNNSRDRTSVCIPSNEEINMLNRPKYHPCSAYNGEPTTCMEGPTGEIFGVEFRSRVQQLLYPQNTDELRLVYGALFADSIILHIFKDVWYTVSAGVAHSKLVAKLAGGLNKPSGISIITDAALPRLSKTTLFQDLPRFGGKTGKALQSWMSSNLGQNAIKIDDINRAALNGINFGVVFQELGISNYEKKAEDLYNKCHFQDETQVTSKFHPDSIRIYYSFKGSEPKSVFNEGVFNISNDMGDRIDYYRRSAGRIARELIVKFETHSGVRTRASGPMALLQETNQFVSHETIRDFILECISKNGLNRKNISKIHLTARKISNV